MRIISIEIRTMAGRRMQLGTIRATSAADAQSILVDRWRQKYSNEYVPSMPIGNQTDVVAHIHFQAHTLILTDHGRQDEERAALESLFSGRLNAETT